MLLSSKGGTISAVKVVEQTRYTWLLIDCEKAEFKVSKNDPNLRVFTLMSQALEWSSGDQELIAYFKKVEAAELAAKSLSADQALSS